VSSFARVVAAACEGGAGQGGPGRKSLAFDGGYPLIGSWVVGDRACGMGLREDSTAITLDTSRFVPHAIVD